MTLYNMLTSAFSLCYRWVRRGYIAAVDPAGWRTIQVTKPSGSRSISRSFAWPLIAVFVLLAAGLFTLSRTFAGYQIKHARVYKEDELAAQANLDMVQVAHWRNDLLALANTIFESPSFSERARDVVTGGEAALRAGQAIAGEIVGLQRTVPFEWAALVLAGGKIVLKVPESAAVVSTPESVSAGHGAWQARKPVLGSIHIDGATGGRSIDLIIPIPSPRDRSEDPVALLRLSFDPEKCLAPLLGAEPARSPSAESLLLERAGDDFIFLVTPRLRGSAALPLRIPIRQFRRPTSRESLGDEGVVEGRDHRGAEVLGFIKAVPGSPWLIMAKTDLGVLRAGMTGRYMTIVAIGWGFVVLCGALLFLLWRRTVASQERFEKTKWGQANRKMDEFIQLMIDIMPNPAFFKDTEGVYRGTNPAFEKLIGQSKKDLIGKTIGDVAPDEIVRMHQEHDQALLTSPGHEVYEAPLKAWDGEHHVIFIKTTYERPDGTVGGILGILKDITQRLRSEEEIEQLRRFSESTVQTMNEGLVLTDSEGKFTFVNPAAAAMLGFTPSEMADREVLSFVPKDQHPVVRRADEKRAKGIADRYELDFIHKDGSRRTFLVSGGPRIQGAHFGGTMAVLTDITDRKRMEEEIRALSLRDELTTLYNRRGFMTLADHQIKTATRLKKKVAILYLDVDNLKRINDSGGHKMGDRALVEIAFVLKKSFREADIVGRLGGDEFCVLAMESNKIDAAMLTQRLQAKLDLFNTRSSAEAGFSLSVSIGVFTRDPEYPVTIEEMLSRADHLMYEQKRSKKSGEPAKPPGPSK
jgi:diguanylate cyclase (GGDEF)-like protein/PAS domain S-box-containing protein